MGERKAVYGGSELEEGSSGVVAELAQSHHDLRVFQQAMNLAKEIYRLSKEFPREETYSLTDQLRRSSRSVATCLTEAWLRRRYPAAFLNKLNEAEAEAGETQTWIEFALDCGYWNADTASRLTLGYEAVLKTLAAMGKHSDTWTKNVARPSKRIS